MSYFERADYLFGFFALCTRLLIVSGAAATTSMARSIIRWRNEKLFIQLVGKWKAPGRKAAEYYWSQKPIGKWIFKHQAILANIGALLAPYVEFLHKQFGTGKDALIPDLVFWLNGKLMYLEVDRNSAPTSVIQEKVDKYKRYLVGADAGTLLVVTTGGPRRIKSLLKAIEPLKGTSCVANLGELLEDIGGRVWQVPFAEDSERESGDGDEGQNEPQRRRRLAIPERTPSIKPEVAP